MTVIVTDTGFAPVNTAVKSISLAEFPAEGPVAAVSLDPTDDPQAIEAHFHRIALISVAFPAFNDGRGFTIARRLRRMGYAGRLRASGYVIADQYAMARRSGFDEVEIDEALAARQPEVQWLARANWRAHDHRSRLGL